MESAMAKTERWLGKERERRCTKKAVGRLWRLPLSHTCTHADPYTVEGCR
eukprot:c39705_g1_i1 orf=57-206(+)